MEKMNLYNANDFINVLGDMELAIKYLIVEKRISAEQKFYILDSLKEIERILFMSPEKVLEVYFDNNADEL